MLKTLPTSYRPWLGALAFPLVLLACHPRQRPAKRAEMSPIASAATVSNQPAVSDQALKLPSLSEKFGSGPSLGVAVEPYLIDEQGVVIARHFRRLVAENSMKWGEVCKAENRCDWRRADRIADFARQHGMKMTGHTFVWHQMYPPWVFKDASGNAPKETITQRLREHIFQMVQRYADVVDNWDVVNEAISDTPNQIWRSPAEKSKWFEAYGSEEYVATAFRIAAEATAKFAPDTKLYYNDYGIENADKRKKVIEMIRNLRRQGVRIDGVGIQGHINLKWPSIDELGRAIDEFAAENLLVKVSELDVSVYTDDDLQKKAYQKEVAFDSALDQRLADRYAELFALFRSKSKQLTSVTFWGLSDDHSWLNGWPIGRKNFPLLLDISHQPKAAFRRLLTSE
jgi:endo-1,4-beta-xylanase